MKSRFFLHKAIGCILVALTLVSSAQAAKPNLIVMIADDLGYGDVSCFTKEAVQTPNLDRLAKMGVKFTNGYVAAPLCAPSRAGFYTGVYQQRFGFFDNSGTLPTQQPLLPGVLKAAGYHTGLLGKWHAGGPMPHERGCFDETLCSVRPSPFINYQTPNLARNGVATKFQEYSTDLFAKEALDFIERNKANPFALTIAFNAPHIDHCVEGAGRIKTQFEAARAEGKVLDVPKFPMARPGDAAQFASQFPGDSARADTVATIAALDQAVGRILDKLKETGLDKNTLVVFFADNGAHPENRSENGQLRDYKWTFFEGGIRVPFLAAFPGVFPSGLEYSKPVSALDIFPTVMALTGLKGPEKLDGVNLTPFLKGQELGAPHEALFFMLDSDQHGAVRQGDWKLVIGKKGALLFDLSKDLGETTDLASKEPARVKEMTGGWEAWKSQMAPRPEKKKESNEGHGE